MVAPAVVVVVDVDDDDGDGGGDGVKRERKDEAARWIWDFRSAMSQSASSSMIRAVSRPDCRNHFSALRCPSHAIALPLSILLSFFLRNALRSSSVHAGCSGITISIPVRFAAQRSPALLFDVAADTARTAPKLSVELAVV